MPGYANWGNAFWQGANSGANMATKWVNAYDWGDRYKHGNAFKEGSAEAMDTYNKSIEQAKAIQDEGMRQQAIQDATELRDNTVRKLALEHHGDKGVDVGNRFVQGGDASDQALSNKAYRTYTRRQFNQDPHGAYGSGASTGSIIGDLMFSMSRGSDDPDIKGLMSTFGMTNQNGALYMNDGDTDQPLNMQLLASRLNFFPALTSSYDAWMAQ